MSWLALLSRRVQPHQSKCCSVFESTFDRQEWQDPDTAIFVHTFASKVAHLGRKMTGSCLHWSETQNNQEATNPGQPQLYRPHIKR
mmetsp:Transcript_41539/g.84930  ORF Transcript_41539/g.84930 Transcript_41539/m.84930 type:complete len:86 (+) Transcript_41539:399-656(+)